MKIMEARMTFNEFMAAISNGYPLKFDPNFEENMRINTTEYVSKLDELSSDDKAKLAAEILNSTYFDDKTLETFANCCREGVALKIVTKFGTVIK